MADTTKKLTHSAEELDGAVDTIAELEKTIASHTENTDIHVTTEDKALWNSLQSQIAALETRVAALETTEEV